MRKKFFVISLQDGNAIKTRLKEWWRINGGPTSEISHVLYFSLLSDGWKSAVVGNEVLLISPDAYKALSKLKSKFQNPHEIGDCSCI